VNFDQNLVVGEFFAILKVFQRFSKKVLVKFLKNSCEFQNLGRGERGCVKHGAK
jgi:hypothetical protein